MSAAKALLHRLFRFRPALLLPLALVFSGCNWLMYGFDPTHANVNPSESVISASNVGTLSEAGATSAVSGPISSQPTIGGDVLYATANTAAGGMVYAYAADGSQDCTGSPKTCAPLWSANPGGASHGIGGSPAVDTSEGIVYVAATDGILYGYNASNGSVMWQSPTLGGSVIASPTIANGDIYVPEAYGWVYVFPLTTGYDNANPSCKTNVQDERVCEPQYGDYTPGYVNTSPAVANGVMYVASGSGGYTFYAYEATYDSSRCTGTPFAKGLGASCDTPIWTAASDGGGSSPAVANGLVYMGSLSNGLLALSANGSTNCSGTPYQNETCSPVWVGTTGRMGGGASPAVTSGTNPVVYIGDRKGTLYAFNAINGSPLWTVPTGGGIDSAPTIANGVVYVGCTTQFSDTCPNGLYAFDATSSAQLWTADPGGSVDNSPIVVDDEPQAAVGAVYVGAGNQVYAYTLP